MKSALASVVLMVAAGSGPMDLSLYHLLLCFSTGECGTGLPQPPMTVPAESSEACVISAELPCVVGDL
jgi:hypothetical protein